MNSKKNKTNDKERVIRQQAADWLLLVNENAAESQEQAFTLWLQRSPLHQKIWQQTLSSWQLIGQIPHSQKRKSRRGTVIAIAMAACFLFISLPWFNLYWQADVITATHETHRVLLPDDSEINLASNSAVSINFTSNQRTIKLIKGQAFFRVNRNPERPFVVLTKQAKVTVLGTEFDVETNSENSHIGVASGLVRVENDKTRIHINPGQQASVNHFAITTQEILRSQVSPWQAQRVFFKDRTLSDVVSTLERSYNGFILIADDTLATKRITASFKLNDIDEVINAIALTHDAKVIEISPYIRLIKQ
ncbi:FecR family protein [Pseudoalteromonas prydzensis]|uniref:FecR domain-containing protein n=1 Tax=Pseudoalteromonas prydzensis TaxID=182141 RepID=A0ABR9FKG8_9GAMM|nr:FecR domain-containing protein [Pseudoalteromonas prydzensis]MBE0457297.1 FecR domain-containing protein [Pseudoalteromonas prydzensis]